ncbi:MAG: hypothetical protein V2B19_27580 [Pseudomonadota bacterium]
MAKKTIDPFRNETDSLQIGDLTIENRLDRVSVYGSLDITLDKDGLRKARQLKGIIDSILVELEGSKLPDQIATIPADTISNPFA